MVDDSAVHEPEAKVPRTSPEGSPSSSSSRLFAPHYVLETFNMSWKLERLMMNSGWKRSQSSSSKIGSVLVVMMEMAIRLMKADLLRLALKSWQPWMKQLASRRSKGCLR